VDRQSIVILDFGAQYSQLIARRVREQNVFSVVLPCTVTADEIRTYKPVGIILSGGPGSVYESDAPTCDRRIYDLGLPILGICYGLQLIVHHLGGKISAGAQREYGPAQIHIEGSSELFSGMPRNLQVWMSHGDEAETLPPGFQQISFSSNLKVAAIEHAEKKILAVQFHPEVAHTPFGVDILRNFVLNICGAIPNWTPKRFIDESIAAIRRQVGFGHAICALSGGVDSSVAAVLVDRAMRDEKGHSRLTCVFVDNGVLRKNEFEQVQKNLRDALGLNIIGVDASQRFLTKLAGITDPEEKRKIIGREFIAIFEEEAAKIVAEHRKEGGGAEFLVQGTLYPDVIESRSVRGPSQVIKSHHNVGGLPENMKLKLIEPLKELFKDEVRRIGHDLNIADDILERQPFPGPGLAVRILGEVTPERVALLQEADHIVVSEIKKAGLYTKIWQSFAVLLPVKSVGVMGDMRTYGYTCAVRAVHSQDGMTADVVDLPHEVITHIATRIVNEVKGINRVVYDITSKPPGTIEWE